MNLEFNFEGNFVEISTETSNGYKYKLIMNGTVVYLKHKISTIVSTKDDWVTHDAEACQYLARKYCNDDKPMGFLERLIMFVNNKLNVESDYDKLNKAFLEMETAEIKPYNVELPDYNFKTGYNEFTWNGYYKASELPADFDSELEPEEDNDSNPIRVVTARGTRIRFSKSMFRTYCRRFGSFTEPVSWDYYKSYVVKSMFANADGTPFAPLN